MTLAGVSDIYARELAQVEDAVRNFAVLAGPMINGYAFCKPANVAQLKATRQNNGMDRKFCWK